MKGLRIPGLGLPVNTIFCIGRNYADHAKEMGHKPPKEPMVFIKSRNSICFDGSEITIPTQSDDVHHEVELVIAIKKPGKNIPPENALEYIAGYGVGIDFTARDLQKKAKKKGHPWSVCKGFDDFGPISSFVPFEGNEFPELTLSLSVNEEIRQQGSTSMMLFTVEKLISYLSGIFTLEEGDLIFTGTPEGVSAVQAGDHISATLNTNHTSLTVTIQ
ncbi:MAG: FAA hydrolase family protein [Balneola sp.]|nr:MAG: FAA hydrolase family protein [Balneola sp.]